MWDRDEGRVDDFLGLASLRLMSVGAEGRWEGWLALTDKSGQQQQQEQEQAAAGMTGEGGSSKGWGELEVSVEVTFGQGGHVRETSLLREAGRLQRWFFSGGGVSLEERYILHEELGCAWIHAIRKPLPPPPSPPPAAAAAASIASG